MGREVKGRMTPEGLVIPRSALEGWRDVELEIVQDEHGIVIRPKSAGPAEPTKAREVLREAGLLYRTDLGTRPVTGTHPVNLTSQQEHELSIQALREDGLLVEMERPAIQPPVSEEKRAELARKLSVGRPLSEIIIEEREAGW